MSDELFRDIIVEHSQHPRCHGRLDHPTHAGHGDNPLCGDKVDIELLVDADGVIEDAAIRTVGCAISTASASLLATAVKGLSTKAALELFERVRARLTGGGEPGASDLGELEALSVVQRYPMRVKCATLAWHTLRQALSESGQTASTE